MKNPFTVVSAFFDGDLSNPRQRFIYLDGAPYGSRYLSRLIMTPSVQAASLIAVFVSAGFALNNRPENRSQIFTAAIVNQLVCFGGLHILNRRRMLKQCPDLDNIVIDKTGRSHSDADTHRKVLSHLNSQAIVAPVASVTAVIGLYYLSHSFAYANLVETSAGAGFAFFANGKIKTGKWSVQSKPPALTRKEYVNLLGMIPAAIPVISQRQLPTLSLLPK